MKESYLWDAVRGSVCCLLGFGVSNVQLADILLERGAACVRVYDKKSPEQLGERALELQSRGVKFFCGEDYLKNLAGDVIFRSPGFRPDKPEIAAAVANGAILTSEMELFLASTEARVVGITGSDGKTTTTTLTKLLLEEAVRERGYGKVYVGGNIGNSLLPYVQDMTADDFAVVELSSFQLMTMENPLPYSAVTNLSPNHLDWHTGMEEYVAAKRHIFEGAGAERLVTNRDCALTYEMVQGLDVPLTLFSSKLHDYESVMGNVQGRAVFLRDDCIVCADGTQERIMLDVGEILLPGMHNVENYMTAIGLTEDYITPGIASRVARSFGGVEHRMQLVREKDGVRYYNSSIDSTPTRTAAALSGIPARCAWVICGGYDKHIPFAPLAKVLRERAKGVVLTGATAGQIQAALDACTEGNPDLPVYCEHDFADAVRCAASHAKKGEMVLLSPACASFDAFANFAQRGHAFMEIVNQL
ncbi:MAG: UDP-N-acetylmuramoyl-L-alanine--D-glutamate ligase [Clostridia bacterium]|nr:UDP-N-acetylmuramoyl-L-alanine--D-glutamate ligase [Clostridia bacterium]